MRRRSWGKAAAIIGAGLIGVPGVAVPAGASGPSKSTLTVSPSTLGSLGGSVTLTPPTTVGLSCTSVASTPELSDLPTCSTPLPWPAFVIPENGGRKTIKYTFTYAGTRLIGSGTVKATASITVSPATGSTYVALGDSFSAGDGNEAKGWVNQVGVADGSSQANDGCNRSSEGYPELVNEWLGKQKTLPTMSFSFLACSGATTTDVYSGSPSAENGLVGNTGDNGEGEQLSYPSLASARIVTLTAGGNDLDFSDILNNCQTEFPDHQPHSCDANSDDGWIADLGENIVTLEASLLSTYDQVKADAPTNAQIYVLGYPDVFTSAPTTGCQGLSGAAISYLASMQAPLDSEIQEAAEQAGVNYVDPNTGPDSFVGHDMCESRGKRWFNSLNVTGGGTGASFHPNKQGQAALAADVEAAIRSTPTSSARLGGVKSITGDGASNCAVLISGGVDCWGENTYGQIGNGTVGGPDACQSTTCYDIPQPVTGISSATEVSTDGRGDYCALLAIGGIDCWGYNPEGELGNGTFGGPDGQGGYDTPQVVAGIPDATELVSGYFGYCAVLANGGVDCWGDDRDGELGNGTTFGQNDGPAYDTPQVVIGVTNATTLSTDDGGGTYCAVLATGDIDCWGSGTEGELGDESVTSSDTAESVVGISSAASVTGGYYGFCATLATGGVDCWGDNSYGEIGDGTIDSPETCDVYAYCSDAPQAVTGIANAVSVTSVSYAYCVLLTSGGVECWGQNADGDFGNGTSTGPLACFTTYSCYDTPQPVSGIADATQLTSGYYGFCVVLASGDIDCWGDNERGQLGNGTIGGPVNDGYGYDTPQTVIGISDAKVLSTENGNGFCAILSTGSADCWGDNTDGELGNGTVGGSDNIGGFDTPQAVLAAS